MNLFEKTIYVLGEEYTTIRRTLKGSWDGLETPERLVVFSVVLFLLMVMFLSRMRRVRSVDYFKARERDRAVGHFYAALVVVIVFSFGIDIMVDQYR